MANLKKYFIITGVSAAMGLGTMGLGTLAYSYFNQSKNIKEYYETKEEIKDLRNSTFKIDDLFYKESSDKIDDIGAKILDLESKVEELDSSKKFIGPLNNYKKNKSLTDKIGYGFLGLSGLLGLITGFKYFRRGDKNQDIKTK